MRERVLIQSLLIWGALETAVTIAMYGVGVHTVRFLADCLYTHMCAPKPSWDGFFSSFVTANSDACTILRKTTGMCNDAMALFVVSGVHWISRTLSR